jgi:hypothetical protein
MSRNASPNGPPTLDDVRSIGMALPDVEERTIHGAMSLKLNGKLMACPAMHKSAESHSLMLRVSRATRAELIASDPHIYYLTEHYASHPAVLVRLQNLTRRSLKAILLTAWQFAKES